MTGLPSGLSNNIIIADGAGNIRINVSAGGNVGIGTTSPSTAFQVNGEISPTSDATYNFGDSSLRFLNVYAQNGTIQTSDAREKKDIQNSDLGLDFINRLRPVSFYWRTGVDGKMHYGLIAQDTAQAIIESKSAAAQTDHANSDVIASLDKKANRWGLRYTELISPMIKAIQEVYEYTKSAHNEIEMLKSENTMLKERIEKLERRVH